MIRALDAWALRRVILDRSSEGERRAMRPPFGPLSDRLAEMPPEARQEALGCFLDARPDSSEIIEALATVDPLGPPPAPDAEEASDWPPLRFGGLPPVDPFPVEVLPGAAARLVVDGADAIACPPDFLGVFLLALAGGTIGRSVSLRLKDDYFAGATIFAGGIGPPSDGKTPALKAVARAVRRIDRLLEAEHSQALELWKEESERAGPDGKKSKPPPPPKPRRIDVDDITMEAIPIILADNPRGLVMIRDEMTAFLLGMNQFKGGKGNDRAVSLKLWSGDAIKKDRVGHEANMPIRCAHPSLSIVGGLTPDMLGAMLDPKGRADGFLDRFLLTYPDPLPVADWSERGIPEETTEEWCRLLARIWARPMTVSNGQTVPNVAHFTPEARALWRRSYDAHAAEMRGEDFPPGLRGPWGKLREYAGRLALILACLEHAADPDANPADVPSVGPRIVANAWRLVAYFKGHARRVQAAIALGPGIGGGPVVKAIVDWLRAGPRLRFSERDVKQARRWITPEELAEALEYLSERNAIRALDDPPDASKVGRPHTPTHDVNPALLDTQNPQNTRNLAPDADGDRSFEGFERFENE